MAVTASSRTAKFRRAKAYKEKTPIWSQIKLVYMELQQSKCAYCERKLESGTEGKIEWDVEHYRPKSQVRKWPEESRWNKLAYEFNLGTASKKGYYLLPYDIQNYLTSCKVCNTIHKLDFFPIAAKKRLTTTSDSKRLLKEKPFLPYPIGIIDTDPEEIITFQGYLCIPVAAAGELRNRALVTIDFFGLNERKTLLHERAELISTAWVLLQKCRQDPADQVTAKLVALFGTDSCKHANCVRSFIKTYKADPDLAKSYVDKAMEYLAQDP
jgi:hypothetical protein